MAEALDDHEARVALVLALHLLAGERARHRHVPAEVVGVGGADAADGQPRLRERGCRLGVRVDDAAAGERAVELEVGRRVGRGPEATVHDLPGLERDRHHVVGGLLVVGDAARLDHQQPGRAVDPGDVAERPVHETALGQRLVGAVDLSRSSTATCPIAHPLLA